MCCRQAASGGVMMVELAANERAVHGDFFNGMFSLLSKLFSK